MNLHCSTSSHLSQVLDPWEDTPVPPDNSNSEIRCLLDEIRQSWQRPGTRALGTVAAVLSREQKPPSSFETPTLLLISPDRRISNATSHCNLMQFTADVGSRIMWVIWVFLTRLCACKKGNQQGKSCRDTGGTNSSLPQTMWSNKNNSCPYLTNTRPCLNIWKLSQSTVLFYTCLLPPKHQAYYSCMCLSLTESYVWVQADKADSPGVEPNAVPLVTLEVLALRRALLLHCIPNSCSCHDDETDGASGKQVLKEPFKMATQHCLDSPAVGPQAQWSCVCFTPSKSLTACNNASHFTFSLNGRGSTS